MWEKKRSWEAEEERLKGVSASHALFFRNDIFQIG